jgi:integrase
VVSKQNADFLALCRHRLARTGNPENESVAVQEVLAVDEYRVFADNIYPLIHAAAVIDFLRPEWNKNRQRFRGKRPQGVNLSQSERQDGVQPVRLLIFQRGELAEVFSRCSEQGFGDGICKDYLFESNFQPGEPFRNNTFYEWFMGAINAAGISYAKHNRREHGPCPHCLRHCFTLKSFLKSENEGRRYEDTAPFLAAYLGHDSSKDTEAYLRSNHTVYTQSHQRVDAAIGHLFPEVSFDEN